MREFKITERIQIKCSSQNTRDGFKHVARLVYDGEEVQTSSVSYLNRTWERFEFQSAMKQLIDKSKVLSDEEKNLCNTFIEEGKHTDDSMLKSTAMVAMMGDIFCQDKKESNDWKARMIKAGLGEGIQMPADWDELDEETKELRLNKVITQLKGESQ